MDTQSVITIIHGGENSAVDFIQQKMLLMFIAKYCLKLESIVRINYFLTH